MELKKNDETNMTFVNFCKNMNYLRRIFSFDNHYTLLYNNTDT